MARPRRPSVRSVTAVTLPLLAAALVGCPGRRPAVDPSYRAEVEAWRRQRVARLTAPEGWLSVVGLVWLQPGDNPIGSAPDNAVVLPPAAPPHVGVIDLAADGRATLRARPDAGLTLAGAPVAERTLRTDRDGEPDVLAVGSLRFYLIARGDQLAVRIKDSAAAARREFKGIDAYPVDPRYRVEGTYEPLPRPREVEIPSAQGPAQRMIVPGVVRFTLLGRACSLEPLLSSPDDNAFFFVFRDATSGKETYGAGRFLDTDAPKPGTNAVTLDFNYAYNPPCAFTAYATCPIPPPENTLALPVRAGERAPGAH